jgi:hypothetical protein
VVKEHPDDIVLDLDMDETSDEIVKRAALAEVMNYTVRMTRAVVFAREMRTWPWRPIVLALTATLTLAFTALTFLVFPDWVFGGAVGSMSPARREAGLRMAMFLAGERVSTWRDTRGATPGTIRDAGEDWPGLTYRSSDGQSFEIIMPNGRTPLVLRSSDDARAFLGLSRRFLRERE